MWVFCIILGVIIVLIGLVMTSATPDMKDGYFVIAMGVMLSVASILNIKANKQKKAAIRETERKEQEKRETLNCIWGDTLPHTTGLPLAEGTECLVYYLADKLIIEGGGTSFILPLERLSDISVTTSEELQKSYVSSVGGAVGGAVLFGPLGAMIGGRAKEKTSRILTFFLVFAYHKDNEIKYIAFDVTNKSNHAEELKKIFNEKPKTNIEIEL